MVSLNSQISPLSALRSPLYALTLYALRSTLNAQPDGTFRKLLDVSKINRLGWKEKTGLEEGIKIVYSKYSK